MLRSLQYRLFRPGNYNRNLRIFGFAALFFVFINISAIINSKVHVKIYSADQITCRECLACKKPSINTQETESLNSSTRPWCFPQIKPQSQHSVCSEPHFSLKALSQAHPELKNGGIWAPKNCISRSHVTIVIPYRNREFHLITVLNRLHVMLQRQLLSYQIIVAEQVDEDTNFNRGMIKNIGFVTGSTNGIILLPGQISCTIFHDVDLVPVSDNNLYTCPEAGIAKHHIGSIDMWDYQVAYDTLVGGVYAIQNKDFWDLNGFSNLYFLWGAEDDDLFMRMHGNKLRLRRNGKFRGRYLMLTHAPTKRNEYREKLLDKSLERYQEEGLNTLKYKTIQKEYSNLYLKVSVRINETEILLTSPAGIKYLEFQNYRPGIIRKIFSSIVNVCDTFFIKLGTFLDPFNVIQPLFQSSVPKEILLAE